MSANMTLVASPCINVCTLDVLGRQCLGCYRTLDEIATWGTMREDDKARVVAMLPARKMQVEMRASGAVTRKCSQCGAAFGCGAELPAQKCWCASLPPVAPSPDRAGCLCPECLGVVALGR
jgi:uncharacterized protein